MKKLVLALFVLLLSATPILANAEDEMPAGDKAATAEELGDKAPASGEGEGEGEGEEAAEEAAE